MYRRLLELLKLTKPRQPHLPQTNVSGQVCGGCHKQMTAGAFPKWVCLRKDCSKYLEPQTLR
jgi:hypothetical protein